MRATRNLLIGLIASGAAMAGNPSRDAVPLFFIQNQGQAPSPVLFMAKGSGVTAWFSPAEAHFRMAGVSVRLTFEGANPAARVEGMDGLPAHVNFLMGASENWRMDVPTYRAIRYRDLYPGIDMIYGGTGRDLKSEFIVAPGADMARIRMRYVGTGDLRIEESGALVIPLSAREGAAEGIREMREQAPILYQEYNGQRVPVEGRFVLLDGHGVGFAVGKYDLAHPLVIDPVLSYSTLLGGSGFDSAMALSVDSAGSAYIAGFTDSFDLPAASPEQNFNAGGNDVFVAKLNPSGNGLVYCTYLGGRGDDRAYGIAVDSSGSAYITGSTASTNFPVRNALQSSLAGGRNAFLARLTPAGNVLVFSTYLGGNGSDTAYGVALDGSGNAYIAGDTTSTNFPASGVQRAYHGAQDAFVAKVAADGSRLVYSTYLGGGNADHGAAIAVDFGGSAYVTGSTWSTDFPVANAFQNAVAGGQDAFLTRLSADGSTLLFSTWLGGSGGTVAYPEAGLAIALDGQGNAYVTGVTSSSDFPTLHALQSTLSGFSDAFVSKVSASGVLAYSTYLGGSGVEVGNAIVVDSSGRAYVAGYTYSPDLPVVNALQPGIAGAYDAFLACLSPAGDSLSYLSYLGGNNSDTATALALDRAGAVYVAGWTLSSNFPLLNPIQSTNAGNYGAFVTKMVLSTPPATIGVANTHSGSFTQGQNGATYSVTVSDGAGSGPTSGMVTVTETVPAGMTLVSMTGTGWTWASGGATCTRSDVLAGGTSYPAITVMVNVAGNAGSPLVNQVNVTGGGTAGANATDSTTINVAATKGIAGDFNGDGHGDVIWQDPVTGLVQIWLLGGGQGTGLLGAVNLTAGNTWRVVGVGDFNQDGHLDVVWQDPVSGAAQVWFLGGAQGNVVTGTAVLSTGNYWRIMSVADFNGDGRPDCLWQDPVTGLAQIWLMGGAQGVTVTGAVNLTAGNTWRIVGTGDFNQDGHPDVVWQDPVTGTVQVWYLNGTQGNVVFNAVNLAGSNPWRIASVGDYNGDGHPDLVWQDPVNGTSQVWFLGGAQGTTVTGSSALSGANSWRIAGPR